MPFRIHGQDLLFDIRTDAGLVLFQKLRFKFTLPVTGNKNLDFAETGPQIFAAVAVPAVVRSFVLVVVSAVTKILIQFSLQTILRAFSSGLRFFRDISFSSILMLLFYTSPEVYTIIGMVSQKPCRPRFFGVT